MYILSHSFASVISIYPRIEMPFIINSHSCSLYKMGMAQLDY